MVKLQLIWVLPAYLFFLLYRVPFTATWTELLWLLHVTGAAALYASTHPGATAAQIKAAILNSTIATPSLQGKTVTGGRLNVSGF